MARSKAEAEAHENADLLKEECQGTMGGKWRKRVWENMGWHHAVDIDTDGVKISVHPCRGTTPTGFNAFLNTSGESGGLWAAYGRGPREAVLNVIKRGRENIMPKLAVLDGATAFMERSCESQKQSTRKKSASDLTS